MVDMESTVALFPDTISRLVRCDSMGHLTPQERDPTVKRIPERNPVDNNENTWKKKGMKEEMISTLLSPNLVDSGEERREPMKEKPNVKKNSIPNNSRSIPLNSK